MHVKSEVFFGLGDILCISSMEKLCLFLESSIELTHKSNIISVLIGEEKATMSFVKLELTKLENRLNTERQNIIKL